MGRLAEALESFEQAIASHRPRDSWAALDGFNERREPHFMKGLVLSELGRHTEAIAALRSAADAMPPGLPEPHASLCAALFARFQRQLAAERSAQTAANDTFLVERVVGHCDTAIAAPPPAGRRWEGSLKKALAHAHRTRAQILSSLGRMSEARLSSASALRLAANHVPLAAELEAAPPPTLEAHATLHTLWPIRAGREEHGPNGADPFALVGPHRHFTLSQSFPHTNLISRCGLGLRCPWLRACAEAVVLPPQQSYQHDSLSLSLSHTHTHTHARAHNSQRVVFV